ncbi:uncharacterized protein [Odocoileus virginianus]|uniref:Collagen alpha-1(I) chain-like n=1 Tax=Odocoileus virginianus TaxID=9874 RepID=A0ABM4HI43_ODOVR
MWELHLYFFSEEMALPGGRRARAGSALNEAGSALDGVRKPPHNLKKSRKLPHSKTILGEQVRRHSHFVKEIIFTAEQKFCGSSTPPKLGNTGTEGTRSIPETGFGRARAARRPRSRCHAHLPGRGRCQRGHRGGGPGGGGKRRAARPARPPRVPITPAPLPRAPLRGCSLLTLDADARDTAKNKKKGPASPQTALLRGAQQRSGAREAEPSGPGRPGEGGSREERCGAGLEPTPLLTGGSRRAFGTGLRQTSRAVSMFLKEPSPGGLDLPPAVISQRSFVERWDTPPVCSRENLKALGCSPSGIL